MHRTKEYRLALASLLAVVLAGACNSGTPEAGTAPARIFKVETLTVATEDVEVRIEAVGDVKASEEALVRPQVDGVIAAILFQEGAAVEAGQTLIRLDDRKAAASLALAEAARDSAIARLGITEQRLERNRRLIADELVSRETFETLEAEHSAARAAVRESEAAVTLAARKLEDFRIVAPFAGMVGERMFDVGNYVSRGKALVRLVKTDPIEIGFGVPDRHGEQLSMGTRVLVDKGDGSEVLEGRIDFIDPRIDPATRMLSLKASIANTEAALRSGQFVEVTIIAEVHRDQVVIPEEAVLTLEGKTWVFVVSGDVAERRLVGLGTRLPRRVEIKSGLSGGETIVVSGQHRLDEGDRVEARSAGAVPGA